MQIKQGDIVLVPFPFSDLSSVKTRPALVVSNASLKGEDCILLAITSQSSRFPQVALSDLDLEKGTLPVKSYVRTGKMVTLNKDIIRRVVARISKVKRQEVQEQVAGFLAIF